MHERVRRTCVCAPIARRTNEYGRRNVSATDVLDSKTRGPGEGYIFADPSSPYSNRESVRGDFFPSVTFSWFLRQNYALAIVYLSRISRSRSSHMVFNVLRIIVILAIRPVYARPIRVRFFYSSFRKVLLPDVLSKHPLVRPSDLNVRLRTSDKSTTTITS